MQAQINQLSEQGKLTAERLKDIESQRQAAQVQVPVKYKGFDIPSVFMVGYGLDYSERYRELPYVGTLRPEVYAQ